MLMLEQGIEDYLNQAFYDGEPFHANDLPVEHIVNGNPIKSYFYHFQDDQGKSPDSSILTKEIRRLFQPEHLNSW